MVYFLEQIDLEDKIHPFTGKEYSEDSTIFILEENDSSDMVCCQNDNGIYTVRLGLGDENWKMKAGDFISYADAEELDAVVCIAAQRLCEVREAYAGHVYNDRKLRSYEPNYLVHSTTHECGKLILKDRCLKSWNCLKREHRIGEEYPIGRNLGDPEYFSDYIMFSRGEVSSEIVVMSKQAGEILMDVNHEYKTGMRF